MDNSLEILWKAWTGIPENERILYSGIGVHCMDTEGNRIGTPWPNGSCISNDLDIAFKYHVTGEKWGPIRTDIMREYKNLEKTLYKRKSTLRIMKMQRVKCVLL